jgi:hypothetical protein
MVLKLNNESAVEVCDARDDAMKTEAGNKKQCKALKK